MAEVEPEQNGAGDKKEEMKNAAVVENVQENNKTEESEKASKSDEASKNNVKSDADHKKEIMTPELERKIIRQMEFYFGDLNLARDRFMQGEIKENDGWIHMTTMLKFNRLKTICEDADKIVEATKKSTSGLLEFSEDDLKVRRCPSKPVPSNTEERRADIKSRTCYSKGFPVDYVMDDLLAFFDQHCSTELIQMRRTAKREFKGSVFVIFPTTEEAKKFLELKDLKVRDDGEELVKMTKDQYFQTKIDNRKNGKKAKNEGGKDGELKSKEQKEALEKEEKMIREKLTPGAILHLVGMPADAVRDDIKAVFGGDDGNIAWIDFDKGDSDAWLRFEDDNGAQKAWDEFSKDDKIIIKDSEVRADVLEGEVEFNHWKNIFQSRADRNNTRRGGGRGRGRGKGRGRGGWGGKGRRQDNDGPPNKRSRRD